MVSATGKLMGGDFRVSGRRATADERSVAVAFNPITDQFLVVWMERRNYETRDTDIYGRLVSATGDLLGQERRISGGGAVSGTDYPAVAYNPDDNEFLVVWGDGRDSASSIFARRVSATGVPINPDFRVTRKNSSAAAVLPAVAYNSGAGEYLVVWQDWRDQATRGSDIYGRRVSRSGSLPAGDFRVVGRKATDDDTSPEVAANPTASEWLVVWSDNRDVFGRRVAP